MFVIMEVFHLSCCLYTHVAKCSGATNCLNERLALILCEMHHKIILVPSMAADVAYNMKVHFKVINVD